MKNREKKQIFHGQNRVNAVGLSGPPELVPKNGLGENLTDLAMIKIKTKLN